MNSGEMYTMVNIINKNKQQTWKWGSGVDVRFEVLSFLKKFFRENR